MDINPRIMTKLEAFLSQLGERQARKLAEAVERDHLAGGTVLPHRQILNAIRPILKRSAGMRAGTPTPLRIFCEPFEDLLSSEEEPLNKPGRISRVSLNIIWTWLGKELMPDTLHDLTGRLADHTLNVKSESRSAVSSVLHAAASAALRNGLQSGYFQEIAHQEGRTSEGVAYIMEDIRYVADALEMASLAERIKALIKKPLREFEGDVVVQAARLAEPLIQSQPHLLWTFVFLVKARLAKPWQILRLARTLDESLVESRKENWQVADEVGRFLTAELETFAVDLDHQIEIISDPRHVSNIAVRLLSACENIRSEIQNAPFHPSQVEGLANIRIRLAGYLCDICDRAPGEISRMLPLQSYGLYTCTGAGADLQGPPEEDAVSRARMFAQFLGEPSPLFEQLGIEAVHAGARHLAMRHLRLLQHALQQELASAQANPESRAAIFKTLCDELIETINAPAQAFARAG